MLLKLFVVLLTSSLVKSSAIDINILKDEKTKEVSLTICDENACEAICKIFGYKDGHCSNGQCMCLYYTREKYHTEMVRSQTDCDDLTCSLTCSAVGFIGGLCVEDDCQCYDINHIKLFKKHHTKEVVSESYCDELTCYVWCIASGSIGGRCAGDSCYCYTTKPLKGISHLEPKPKASFSLADSCNTQTCDQLCREFGFPGGGACVGDSCECIIFKPLQEFLSLIVLKKSIERENSGEHQKIIKDHYKKTIQCDVEACNEFCHRSNYIGGVCIAGNSCNCY